MSSNYDNIINATSSSSGTTAVDGISNDIGRMDISNDDGDVSRIDISDGEGGKIHNKKKCTSCEQKVENIKTNNISHANVDIDMVSEDVGSDIDAKETCANCGKDGASNVCNKCKLVKYCNAVCKKKHKKKHKKECEEYVRHAAKKHEEEVRRAAELHDIELFKQSPQQEEECPICFQRIPLLSTGKKYKSCCGKVICSGCVHAQFIRDVPLCPFCRTLEPTSEDEVVKRMMKRVEKDDVQANSSLGSFYAHGNWGLSQDMNKALEFWHRAAELGHTQAYFSIGCAYYNGIGVKKDKKKANHYFELAAMRGDAAARHSLGVHEWNAGNDDRALKHFLISVEGGYNGALKKIQQLYSNGDTTKDVYTQALRAYQKYLAEIRSAQRDEAAAFDEGFKYID